MNLKSIAIIFIFLLLGSFVSAADVSGTVWVPAGSGASQYECPTPGKIGLGDVITLRGFNQISTGSSVQLECVYDCKTFSWADPFGLGKTGTPINGEVRRTISPGGDVIISDVDIRNACCSTIAGVCYSSIQLQCYYSDTPGSCSNSIYTGGGSCKCTVSLFRLDGTVDTQNLDSCAQCENLREQCPSGYFYMGNLGATGQCCSENLKHGDNQCCISPNVLITNTKGDLTCCSESNIGVSAECCRSDLREVDGEKICCDDSSREGCGKIVSPCPPDKIYAGNKCCEDGIIYNFGKGCCNEPLKYDERNNPVCCADTPYNAVCDSSKITTDFGNDVDFTCNSCRFNDYTVGLNGRVSGLVNCRISATSSSQNALKLANDEFRLPKMVSIQVSNAVFHSQPSVQTEYYLDGVGNIPCQVPFSPGCDADGANAICPSGCRSWEDPDCNYAENGPRLWADTIGQLLPVQEWWNDQLSNGVIGDIYSALEYIPLTVEWWTARMCRYGVKYTDEEICTNMGLEGNCSAEWDVPSDLSGDATSILMAAEYSSAETRYRFSWRIKNLPGVNYRARVLRFAGGYDSNIADQKIFYPEEEPVTLLNTLGATNFVAATDGVVNQELVEPMIYVDGVLTGYEKICLDFEVDKNAENYEDNAANFKDIFWTELEFAEVCRTIVKN